jgi:HNH endonuclease
MLSPTKRIEHFWSRVFVTESPDACWIWDGTTTQHGYGKIRTGRGTTTGAHRFAWESKHGPIPHGLRVLHRCDNPICVNPDHLFLGTQRDNIHDMIEKRRHLHGDAHRAAVSLRLPRGSHVHGAKLTEDGVRAMRARYAQGESMRQLAAAFGIRKGTVWQVVTGKSWKHVS